MSIKYSVTALKNPLRPDESPKYYAKAQVREVINMERLSKEIAHATSLTEGDVYNVLRNLPYQIKTHLADGDMVELGEMGKFQFQVKSTGADNREDFKFHNIKKARFQFRPGKLISDTLANLDYEEVMPVKVKKEIMRQMKQTPLKP